LANPTFHIPDAPRRWPRRLLWLLAMLPLLLVVGAAVYQGQFLAERALRLSLGEGALQYAPAMPGWDGTIRLSTLRIGEQAAGRVWLKAARVEISGHGWWWLLRNALRQKRLEAVLPQLRISFHELDTGTGLDPALGELAPAGLSGAPFETLGCPATVRFDAEGLAAAELALHNRLSFDFRVDGAALDTRIEYVLQDGARFQRRMQQVLPMPLSLLVIDQYPLRTQEEHWELEDLGFSRVRHRRCGERGELIAFVDRHVEAARRALRAKGLDASEEAWALYRRYVRDGGSLELALRYPDPAPLDGWFDRPRPAALLALSEAQLSRESQQVEFVPAGAFTDGLPGASSKQTQRLALADTLWIDPDTSMVLREPERNGPSGPLAPAHAHAEEVAGDEDADGSEVKPDPATDAAAPATADTPPAPVPVAPDRQPTAASRNRSELIPEARVVVVGETPPRTLSWEQLQSKVGARLRITTRTGSTRVAELVSWSAGEIAIRQRIGGGIAESRIQREMFREAVAL
jgi:hypothetical protein